MKLLNFTTAPLVRSVLGRAVVTHKAEPLTSDIVVCALGALGNAQINKALGKGGPDHLPRAHRAGRPGLAG